MDIETLSKFLNEANKATYANKTAPKVTSSRLKSEDYHFEKNGLIYHDTYFGGRDFIGEEIVYDNEKPVWVQIILVSFLMKRLAKKMFTISSEKHSCRSIMMLFRFEDQQSFLMANGLTNLQ